MSQATNIEWTDATWNPIRGCSRVSEGCRHCYAETVANRFCGPGSPYEGLVRIGADGKGTGQWNGEIKFVEKHLLDPLKWRKPRRIFVNSMSDLFHENVTDEMLDRIFAVMALCPQHTFQVLTKRPERMLAYISEWGCGGNVVAAASNIAFDLQSLKAHRRIAKPINASEIVYDFGENRDEAGCRISMQWPLPNVWLGVSVENQKAADERIPLLLQTPAAQRFVSAEPLLGPVDLARVPRTDLPGVASGTQLLHWVICGGESGPGARPMHPDWARSLRDQCKAAGVPFFFKQWGEWAPTVVEGDGVIRLAIPHVRAVPASVARKPECAFGDDGLPMLRVGKKAAGHLLDGEVIQQFPEGIACSGGKSA